MPAGPAEARPAGLLNWHDVDVSSHETAQAAAGVELLEAVHADLAATACPSPCPARSRSPGYPAALAQLEDYILPRYRSLDAPLLAVVGGSTGAGKSTLVNALVGHPVTRAGAIRPPPASPSCSTIPLTPRGLKASASCRP